MNADVREFDINNPSLGIRNYAVQKMLNDAYRVKGEKKPEQYTATLLQSLAFAARELKKLDKGSDVKRLLIARAIGDIATLAGFIDKYQQDLVPYLAQYRTKEAGTSSCLFSRKLYSSEH